MLHYEDDEPCTSLEARNVLVLLLVWIKHESALESTLTISSFLPPLSPYNLINFTLLYDDAVGG
jgi:hypothetical protein